MPDLREVIEHLTAACAESRSGLTPNGTQERELIMYATAENDDRDQDVTELEGGSSGPPAGEYVAAFVGLKKTNHEKWGPGLQFRFKVLEGPEAGSETVRTGKAVPRPSNSSGRLLAGLLGRPFAPKEKLSIGNLVGKRFRVLVNAGKDGVSTRLDSIIRIPSEGY